MTSPNSYPVILIIKFILIIIFTGIYFNIYRETKSSFYQDSTNRKILADSVEIILKIKNDSVIRNSYEEYKNVLKVQKSVVDNIYNKLKNNNTDNLSSRVIDRPEHKSIAYVNNLNNKQFYGDTIARIEDTANCKTFYTIYREVKHTYNLGYKQKVIVFNLEKAIKETSDAIDFDRDLCNRVIDNTTFNIVNKQSQLNNTLHKIDATISDFFIFTATIEFTFNYTDIEPSSSKVHIITLIHKILAGILYFILINQLKKKFFP